MKVLAKKIEIVLPGENVRAVAILLEDEAPKTCEAVWKALPIEGQLWHGMFSGNESYVPLEGDALIRIEPENQTYWNVPGDVGYWYGLWGERKYVRGQQDVAEIIILYGRNVKVRDSTGRPCAYNLFGRVTKNLEGYAEASARIRTEGLKKIIIRKYTE